MIEGSVSFNDFQCNLLKKKEKKTAKVRNSFGVYDCYKHIRKNGWYNIGTPLSEHEFYTIIRSINNAIAKEIALGNDIKLPQKMGSLELRKRERGVSIVDGKLKITYPVNWEETIRLWFEDEQARKDKTLLRDEQKYVYKVKYNKYKANYENKTFYEFTLNRKIKKALKDNINKNKVDALW